MARKYRPPTARRRKSKRTQPYFVEPRPADGEVSSTEVDAVSLADPVPATPAAPQKSSRSPDKDGSRAEAAVRHITRDYSYVRSEVKRIVLVAGFLVISLIMTAILRN